MNWLQLEINVGVVNKGQKYFFEFIKAPTCKGITKVTPTCNCNTAELINNKLIVEYTTPSEVSPEMIKLGIFAQHISKEITIEYSDGTSEILRFYVTILD
jgi:hypothetical protein